MKNKLLFLIMLVFLSSMSSIRIEAQSNDEDPVTIFEARYYTHAEYNESTKRFNDFGEWLECEPFFIKLNSEYDIISININPLKPIVIRLYQLEEELSNIDKEGKKYDMWAWRGWDNDDDFVSVVAKIYDEETPEVQWVLVWPRRLKVAYSGLLIK